MATTLDARTIEMVLRTLDVQRSYCKPDKRDTQFAYYRGLYNMADIIVSDGYAGKLIISVDESGNHHIVDRFTKKEV